VSNFRIGIVAAVLASATALTAVSATAETISGALAKAYQLNSTLNSARARVRVTDEDVAIAKSGYRPTVTGSAAIDYSRSRNRFDSPARENVSTDLRTGSFGVEIQQTLFDGFQTRNNVAAAEAQVRAQQQSLRNDEQDTLFNAASAYMDVIRARQIAVLRERNLEFLVEQERAARSRFDVGEGTRTDVAQAEASRSAAVAQLSAARAEAQSSAAIYRQLIGEEPNSLRSPSPLAKLLPKSLDQAQAFAAEQHPAILATEHAVDAAAFTVKSTEGALLPQVTVSAGVSQDYTNRSPDDSLQNGNATSAGAGLQLTVPIYQGGRTSAQIRQSKESLGQARIQVDVSRDNVRAAVASAWAQYIAARENISAIKETVAAARLALEGVIEERNVGQRTTLDVLDSQSDLIDAQIALVEAERNVVVASYAILSAIGHLSAGYLGLQVAEYKPQEHYKAVKDKWFGLRTPDGR
jgi:outer membrane protein